MSEKDVFKQERKSISPDEVSHPKAKNNAGEEVSMEEVHAFHRELGTDVPGKVEMKGNVPPEMQAIMSHSQQRKLKQDPNQPRQQPMGDPRFTQFKDEAFEAVMRKLNPLSGKYDEISLPSLGKFYSKGEGPSDGKLHIRPMTGHEEQILSTPRFIKKNQSLNMIFKECIGENINPELLLSQDRTYILIYLRGISYSPLYDVEVKCPECTRACQTQIDLNMLDVNECPMDFGPDSLQDTLPASGFKFKYRLSTGMDETQVNEHREKRIKEYGDNAADDTLIFRASLLIEEIEGLTNKLMIQQILKRLPINDVAYLRHLMTEPPFGVDTKVDIVCPHCTNEFDVDMPMEVSFFFPKPNSQKKKQTQELTH